MNLFQDVNEFSDKILDICKNNHVSHEYIYGIEALYFLLKNYQFDTVLDIGAGHGLHSHIFSQFNKKVTALDFAPNDRMGAISVIEDKNVEFICADILNAKIDQTYDLIWCSHTLEHQPNVERFLSKVRSFSPNAIFCYTVPRYKHPIVGGHLTLWNMGLLLYNAVHAGYDLREGRWGSYGYNHSFISRGSIAEKIEFHYENGDIDKIKDYFPIKIHEGFDGRLKDYQWCTTDERRTLSKFHPPYRTIDEVLQQEVIERNNQIKQYKEVSQNMKTIYNHLSKIES